MTGKFLTSALDRREVKFKLRPPYPRRKSPATQSTAGPVGPSASLDVLEKRNSSYPFQETKHDSSVVQPIAQAQFRLRHPAR
jgi:hypothetical protein